MLESSILSVNRDLYGDFHNYGHVFLSFVHDPDGRNLESFGTIGDPSTSMRDPLFYTFHEYVSDMFQEHKQRLPPYSSQQLNYPGITITGAQVQPESGSVNSFQTFWQQSDVDFSRGMDFVPRGSVFARFTHLQHSPFVYSININNASNAQSMGTVRIFMAPRFDERGQPFQLRDQRLMMTEMDRFVVACEFYFPSSKSFFNIYENVFPYHSQ